MSTLLDTLGDFYSMFTGTASTLPGKAVGLAGIAPDGKLSFKETMESAARYNVRVDLKTRENVAFRLDAVAQADLNAGFLDPTDKENFLTFWLTDNSTVTIDDFVDGAEVEYGYLRLHPFRELHYYFEFRRGSNRRYFYDGRKNLARLNQVDAWTTLAGGVFERSSGKKVLDSTLFFGPGNRLLELFRLFRSIRLA